ncbi:MAG TPA: DUF3391 domain-containing protein, partial [Burkholderiaceae bacterium]|nr:DUF3391 domain-containing protein [Burkholderiaceae bacterium]
MTTAPKPGDIRVPIESLRRGLFVAALDRPWSETPFLFQGFLIESDQELRALRELCRWVVIDPAHSDPAALREIAQASERAQDGGAAPATRAPVRPAP